jgi:hypothetical protein
VRTASSWRSSEPSELKRLSTAVGGSTKTSTGLGFTFLPALEGLPALKGTALPALEVTGSVASPTGVIAVRPIVATLEAPEVVAGKVRVAGFDDPEAELAGAKTAGRPPPRWAGKADASCGMSRLVQVKTPRAVTSWRARKARRAHLVTWPRRHPGPAGYPLPLS